jgi:hypothetical protein
MRINYKRYKRERDYGVFEGGTPEKRTKNMKDQDSNFNWVFFVYEANW